MVNQKNLAMARVMLSVRPASRNSCRRMGTLPRARKSLREGIVGVHWQVAGVVVDDVFFGQIVQVVRIANPDSVGEAAVA